MKCFTVLSALAGAALAAIPESYEARLLSGTCNPYGRTMQSGTGWNFLPEMRLSPALTDTAADGLDVTTVTQPVRGGSPYDYVCSSVFLPTVSCSSTPFAQLNPPFFFFFF